MKAVLGIGDRGHQSSASNRVGPSLLYEHHLHLVPVATLTGYAYGPKEPIISGES